MICHKIGLLPISTIGLGLKSVSYDSLVPRPPANIIVFSGFDMFINNLVFY